KAGNRFGYRGNFVWASKRQDHAVYAELPLLYAASSNKFGLSDMRFRYYWVPYRNYSKKPGAFGFALDAYAPTGKFENDLGMGRWIAAPGITTAFVFGSFSTFPVLSYLHCSGILSDKVSAENKKELNGFIMQFVCVYKFSKKNYLDCTPYFIKNSYTNAGKDDFQVESNYLYMVKKNKLQVGGFVRRIFRGNVTTVRASVRLYL
ncbi:MAG TPA: hypothetical protein VN958_01270, partial [Chitinophagaceae bacterium]|nr:hypothetical protein [Chitinophagaceae bacterium]